MIDTHCHLNLDPLIKGYRGYFQAAKDSGVNQVIIPGVNFESSEKAVEIAATVEGLYPAIGIHPDEAEHLLTTKSTQEIYQWLLEWAGKEEVKAIGECGLDYYRLPEDPLQAKHLKAFQKKLFKLHLKVALEVNKPLIIHVRDETSGLEPDGAQAHVIDMLEQHQPRGVLHCFSGDKTYLDKALNLGLYISFAGNITFKNSQNLQAILCLIPQDKLLLETDSPYLNPQRGQWPNTPAQVVQTYQFVANELNLGLDDLDEQVSNNAQSLFRI